MNTNKICIILVRLGAVAIFLSVVYSLVQNIAPYYLDGLSTYTKIGLLMLNVILPAAIAWSLWRFPATIVGKVVPEAQDTDYEALADDKLLVVGIALLGLYVLVFGLLDTLYWESFVVWQKSQADLYSSEAYQSSPVELASRVASFAQVVLGLALVLGRKGSANLILNLRGRAGD